MTETDRAQDLTNKANAVLQIITGISFADATVVLGAVVEAVAKTEEEGKKAKEKVTEALMWARRGSEIKEALDAQVKQSIEIIPPNKSAVPRRRIRKK